MVFVGAVAIATSMPASAFGPTTGFGTSPADNGQGTAEQSLAFDGTASANVTRDDYVVVSPTPTPTPTVVPIAPGQSSGGFACSASAPAETTRITWPYDHPVRQSDGFGPRAEGFHKGVDMLGGDGTPIQSIADGVVYGAGSNGSAGNYVAVAHLVGGTPVCSMYMHFQDGSTAVSVGQVVTAGTVLGLTGRTGNASVEHLHFEMYGLDNVRFDPIPWLSANASY